MKTFKQYVAEALNKPYEYDDDGHYDTDDDQVHKYSFKDKKGVPTHVYISHHVTREPSRASVDFTDAFGNVEATGKGSIRHFSTIKKIMHDHAKKHSHLKSYTFTSQKDENRDDKGGRTRLYKRFVKMSGGHSEYVGNDATKHWIPVNRDKNGD